MKQRMEEYKRQKEDHAKMAEMEMLIKEKAERDFKARMANLEITNYQQRVILLLNKLNANAL